MTIEHHALIKDLPEYREQIHALKTGNTHFAKMFSDYHELTVEIEKIENGGNTTSDEAESEMKMRRVRLKDELLKMLAVEKKDKCGDSCGCS